MKTMIQTLAMSDVAAHYGVKLADENLRGIEQGFTDHNLELPWTVQRQRRRWGVHDAFEANAKLDPTTTMPEPGVIHRAL